MTTRSRTRRVRRPEPSAKHQGVDWHFVERVLCCDVFRVLYIYGPPGVGKTWAAFHLAPNPNGVLAVSLTEDTPAMELRGHYIQTERGMVWQDGNVIRAMRMGATLVVNEASHSADDVRSFLHPILESPETAEMTLPNGDVVKPAPGFRAILTDNLPPEELSEALRSRICARLHITVPHPAALARLSPVLRRAAEATAGLDEERRVSLREWLMLESCRGDLGLEMGAIAVFGEERGPQIFDAMELHKADG